MMDELHQYIAVSSFQEFHKFHELLAAGWLALKQLLRLKQCTW
jgi:hypothetical protein